MREEWGYGRRGAPHAVPARGMAPERLSSIGRLAAQAATYSKRGRSGYEGGSSFGLYVYDVILRCVVWYPQ